MASNWTDKGGYLSFARLSQNLRYAQQPLCPLMRFVREEEVFGGKKGDTINISRLYNLNTAYPTTPLSETAPIPVTDWQQNQIALTLKEWGQAVDLTEKFTALADFDPNEITSRLLSDSMAKFNNNLAANKLKQTSIKMAPVTGTTTTINGATSTAVSGEAYTVVYDGTDPGAWSRNFTNKDIFALRNLMMDVLRIPPMNGQMSEGAEYVIACSQTFVSTLMNDSNIATALNYSKSGAGTNAFIKGWMGNYAGFAFVLDTQNFSTGLDGYAGEAVAFGDDALVQAWAVQPEIRIKNPLDYGRDKGAAWYGLGNLKFVGATSATDVTNYLGRAVHLTTSASPTEL